MVLAIGGRRPREWVEGDILSLIANGVKESVALDYKACAALQKTDGKKGEISKDVSAFANSAGGVLAYGVVESGHLPTGLDVGFDPAQISREWLEQVINSTIQPRIGNVRINQVDLPTTQPGRVLYVVEVPQTVIGGPHQAADHRYYKRFNFQSVPMEDYEVRDVMRRAAAPDLFCTFDLTPQPEVAVEFVPGELFSRPLSLSVGVENRAQEPVSHAVFHLFFDKALEVQTNPDLRETALEAELTFGNRRRQAVVHYRTWGISARLPIFRGIRFALTDSPLAIAVPADHTALEREYFIGCRIMAPGMDEKQQVVALALTGERATIVSTGDPRVGGASG